MKLREINEKLYNSFALKNEYMSIYQLPEWGMLKTTNGWDYVLLGYFDGSKLVGVTMLLSKNTVVKKKLYYAPRGYLLDVFNYELLSGFNKCIIEYIKKNNGFMLKIDPNVIYSIRNSENVIKETVGDVVYKNFCKIGFRHFGFNLNFETLQPRWLCRFPLLKTYEDTLKTFTKSTQKNIIKCFDKGVLVKELKHDEIYRFCNMWHETAKKRNVVIRPNSYYEKMHELMSKYISYYIVYIDTELYYSNTLKLLDNCKVEYKKFLGEIKKINVGDKIKKKKFDLENKIASLEKELSEAELLKGKGPYIDIGALMSVFVGSEGITFMSGTATKYTKFLPKYAFYNKHIQESIRRKMKFVNFYGISGDMNKSNPYYGMYEIKKGFNPDIIELIGEFDYIINPFYYFLYKIGLKLYRLLKIIKK